MTTAPNGSKFVAGVFMGLHRAIPPHEDNVFKEKMQLGLRKGTALQLLQIKANLEFVYPKMPIGRVTTVYELVQRELRNRAMRLVDADLDAAPAVGAAAASQEKSPAQLKLEAIASNLALTLPNPPLARPLDDAALITSFLRQAGEQVQQLMNEGNSFHRSVLLFGAAAHATFLAMEPHTLKRLIKGLKRLDGLPVPTNGAIVQRRLIEVLQKFDAKGMHRRTLDKERKNAPPPKGIAATLKGVGLRGVRAVMQTGRNAESAVAQPRAEREAAKSNDYRIAIFDAMDDAVASTLPGTVAPDTSLNLALNKLMRAANFEGARIDAGEGKQFLALAEDFLLVLRTDVLVGFALELMRTAPTRTTSDVRLDRLSKSLAEVLEMRPGTEVVVAQLRQRERVSGPASPAVLDRWRATRFDELLNDMSSSAGPNNADARATVRGALEDLAGVIFSIEAQALPDGPTTQNFLDESVARLTPAQRDGIQTMLESERLNSPYDNVVDHVLRAIRRAQPAAVNAG
ncbi:MAG: hypothetical protein H7255_01230 [Ramlibacter sp.]|nr:hypothetical protein [Ramlibacter sp.]